MEHVLNLQSSRTAEALARHSDKLLRGQKGVGEDELERLLDQTMRLFKLIQGKDVFETFYKKFLSKRLLLGKCPKEMTILLT